MRISDWSSDVCSSDLHNPAPIKESGVDYPNIVAFLIVGPNGKFVLQGIVPDNLGRGEELEHQVNHARILRSEEHTSELQLLMRSSYAVFCLKKKKTILHTSHDTQNNQHRFHRL